MISETYQWDRSIVTCISLAIASVLCSVEAHAQAKGPSIEEATEEQRNAAKDDYTAGTTAFEAGKFDEALERFQKSYATVASPNSHLMIARSLNRLGREAEAYAEYGRVIDEANEAAKTNKKYEQTARTATNERSELEAKLAFLVARYDGTLVVDGREAPFGEKIPVSPGTITVTFKAPNGETTTTEVEAPAGQETEVRFAAKAPDAPADAPCPVAPAASDQPASGGGIDQRTLGWVFGGVGVAGLATFAIFGSLNSSRFDDIESQCAGNLCPANLADEAETGRTYQTLANVGLGVGIVGLGTGLVLLLTAPRSPETVQGRSPRVSVGWSSVEVTGTF